MPSQSCFDLPFFNPRPVQRQQTTAPGQRQSPSAISSLTKYMTSDELRSKDPLTSLAVNDIPGLIFLLEQVFEGIGKPREAGPTISVLEKFIPTLKSLKVAVERARCSNTLSKHLWDTVDENITGLQNVAWGLKYGTRGGLGRPSPTAEVVLQQAQIWSGQMQKYINAIQDIIQPGPPTGPAKHPPKQRMPKDRRAIKQAW